MPFDLCAMPSDNQRRLVRRSHLRRRAVRRARSRSQERLGELSASSSRASQSVSRVTGLGSRDEPLKAFLCCEPGRGAVRRDW
jgi:hypothetical protein